MILISADGTHFYIHRQRLLEASDTCWSNLLIFPAGVIYQSSLRVTEDSPTLNVVLHIIYRLPLKDLSPCLSTLVAAAHALKTYGISLKPYVSIGMPLFDELAVKIPSMALEVYAIAAENNLFELAREASKHLLSLQVSSLSRETTLRIGPVYLCMLCDLLMERAYVLKCLVIQPPEQHAPTETCGRHEYHELLLDWAKIAYSLVFSDSSGPLRHDFEGNPMKVNQYIDISPELLHATLQQLNLLHPCPECVQSIDHRVQAVVSRWALTPVRVLDS